MEPAQTNGEAMDGAQPAPPNRPAAGGGPWAETPPATTGDPSARSAGLPEVLAHFQDMIDHCHDFAAAAKASGRPIVGIMCEFTPRELILAAGAVPVCLCGGSEQTVAAAEQHLPANLCPLIKSTFGYHVKGTNPFLNWADLVVAETTCDGKKKMFELMGATRPIYVLELPHKVEDPDGLALWTGELRKLQAHLEKRFHVSLTPEKLLPSIRLMNRERRLRRQLADLMAETAPPLTGRQLLDFKSIISGLESDLERYEQAWRLFADGAAAPGSPRARASQAAGPVRVLLTGVPMVHGAERVLELIEGRGAVVVAMENCTGLKPILDDVDETDPDPIRAMARKYFHLPCSVMTPNRARMESLRQLAAKFRPQCVIELVWHACLTYDIESTQVRALVERELQLPYLKITTDYSSSDTARILTRVEALLETATGGR